MRLFRDQALEAHRARLQGEVVLAPPPVGQILTAGLVVTALLAGAALLNVDYARKETAPGFVAPSSGMARVVAPGAGVVAEVLIAEGETVRRGAPLVRLRHQHRDGSGTDPGAAADEALARRIDNVRARIAVANRAHAADTERAAIERTAMLAERAALSARADEQEALRALAAVTLARRTALAERGVASDAARREAETALTAVRAAAAEIAQEAAVLEGRLAALDGVAAVAALTRDRTVAELEAEWLALTQERAEIAARRETLLMAPIDGVVAALTAAPGQDVAPGRALVQILPEGAVFEATLFVPSRAIGFVVPGQDVGIRYDAFPHERFGVFRGRVAAVTRTVIAPDDAPPQLPLNVPAYRVTVALEDQSVSTDDLAAPLQAGMRLQASIALERRSLLDWLLAPLMKSTGSLK